MIIKKLYWNRYRPKNIDGLILLPRIRKELINKDGDIELNGNYLFTGTPGIGKSSMAEILAPEGVLKVNASINSSIEDLRSEVTDYCNTHDIFDNKSLNGFKIVYLDEFDGVSSKYQEALKGFIEEYSGNIRFIATCNNLSKISEPILSRFTVINFDPQNTEEIDYLKKEYLIRCHYICEKNNIKITENEIKNIINSSFPDLRSVMNTLQRIEKTGSSLISTSDINTELYNILFSTTSVDKIYDWIMLNWGDKIDTLLKLCGRPLCQYIINSKPEHIVKLPKLTRIVRDAYSELPIALDPFLLGLNVVYEIQEQLNKK